MDLIEYLKDHPFIGPFRPYAYYNVNGDELQVFWEDNEDYSEEINDGQYNVMSLLKTFENHRIIGINIYSIRKILKDAGFELVKIPNRENEEVNEVKSKESRSN